MLYLLLFILFFTLVPFLISKIKGKWKNYLRYGIAGLLTSVSFYFLAGYYMNCINIGHSGFDGFCGFGGGLGYFLLILAFFFFISSRTPSYEKSVVDSKLLIRIPLYILIFVVLYYVLIYIKFRFID